MISKRALATPPSPIRKIAHLADEAKKRGTKVYHLNIGQPDVESPREFFDGLKTFDQKIISYDPAKGSSKLRSAWSNYLKKTIRVDVDPEEFIITSGASEALLFTFMITCDAGDEIIVFDPTYANYMGFAASVDVKLKPVETFIEEQFQLPSIDVIAKHITGKTKAILLCNPNNPTGTVYSRESIAELLKLCEERDLYFIVDETYRELVYDGLSPLSVFHVAPESKKIIVLDSFSKRFSLCGARIGCLISKDENVLRAATAIASTRLSVGAIDSWAGAHLLDNTDMDIVNKARDHYEERRNALHAALDNVEGVFGSRPQGAFYSVVSIPVNNAEKFCAYLLSDFSHDGSTVFLSPVSGFYVGSDKGKNMVRMAYVLNIEDTVASVEVMEAGLKEYKKNHDS